MKNEAYQGYSRRNDFLGNVLWSGLQFSRSCSDLSPESRESRAEGAREMQQNRHRKRCCWLQQGHYHSKPLEREQECHPSAARMAVVVRRAYTPQSSVLAPQRMCGKAYQYPKNGRKRDFLVRDMVTEKVTFPISNISDSPIQCPFFEVGEDCFAHGGVEFFLIFFAYCRSGSSRLIALFK